MGGPPDNWRPGVELPDVRAFLPSPSEITYRSLSDMSRAPLTEAVNAWDTLVDKLNTMAADADRVMLTRAREARWEGETATVSLEFITLTTRRFGWAHEQAQAIHRILSTLCHDLIDAQSTLSDLRQRAQDHGLSVDAAGMVRWPEAPDYTVTGPSPGLFTDIPLETHQEMVSIQAGIREALAAAEETDSVAARALSEIMESETGSFTPSPYTDLDHAHDTFAREAADEYLELARQEPAEWTESDLHAMRELTAEYGEHPEFAEHVVDTLGMEAYLRLANNLDHTATQLATTDAVRHGLSAGLGTTLNTAMQAPPGMPAGPTDDPAYQAWLQTREGQRYHDRLSDFQEAGRTRLFTGDTWYTSTGDERFGYDVALDLLETSRTPIDERFFVEVMDDLRAWEEEDPTVWNADRYPGEFHEGDSFHDVTLESRRWDIENDLVDRMLGIGAYSNPDAAAAYFDPDGARTAGNLDYYIGDEGRTVLRPNDFAADNPSPGLTAALEAAATGIPPGSSPGPDYRGHSDANIRVAEHTWNTFAEDRSRIQDGEPMAYLKPTLGTIGADYIADVQHGVTGKTMFPGPESASFSQTGSGLLLHELGKDPDVYATITTANNAHLALAVDHSVATGTNLEHVVTSNSHIAGILTDARAVSAYEESLHATEDFNANLGEVQKWTDRVLGSTVDEALGRIPYAGDIAAGIREDITESVFQTFEKDNVDYTADDADDTYQDSVVNHRNNTFEMIQDSMERHENSPYHEEDFDEFRNDIVEWSANGHVRGANTAVAQKWSLTQLPE